MKTNQWLMAALILLGESTYCTGQNLVANCAKQSGDIMCDGSQIAVCIKEENGQTHGKCFTPNANLRGDSLAQAIMKTAQGNSKLNSAELKEAKHLILDGGWVKNGTQYTIAMSPLIKSLLEKK